jgi:SNF2 family DNA or RNA helicase
MRRLKTDKSVIADLLDKIVADEYTNLTTEQAALYESAVCEGPHFQSIC